MEYSYLFTQSIPQLFFKLISIINPGKIQLFAIFKLDCTRFASSDAYILSGILEVYGARLNLVQKLKLDT